jgi:hypothetical protein
MKVGDLVWHIDDIKDNTPTPGIVTALYDDDPTVTEEACVLFSDRGYNEIHPKSELVVNLEAPTR